MYLGVLNTMFLGTSFLSNCHLLSEDFVPVKVSFQHFFFVVSSVGIERIDRSNMIFTMYNINYV